MSSSLTSRPASAAVIAVLILLAVIGAAAAPRSADSDLHSLEGPWKFRIGDDPAWADARYDDSRWAEITVPTGWGPAGYSGSGGALAWYRKTIHLAVGDRNRLALAMGPVDSAYEAYAGGRVIGRVGRLPPNPEPDYDRRRILAIPADAIDADGRVVIAIRAWSPRLTSRAPGLYGAPYAIGPVDALAQRGLDDQVPLLIVVVLLATVGVSHLFVGWRGPEHRWFAALGISMAIYVLARSPLKYDVIDSFVVGKKIEHLPLYFFAIAIPQIVHQLIERAMGRWRRGYQIANAAAGLVVTIAPGLTLNLWVLPFFEVGFLVMAAFGATTIVLAVRAGNRDARSLAFGTLPLIVFGRHDVLLDYGLMISGRWMPYGSIALILMLAMILQRRVKHTHRDLITLRRAIGRASCRER